MKIANFRLALIAIPLIALAACATVPPGPPPEVVRLHNELDRVHGEPNVVAYGGQELTDADSAVASVDQLLIQPGVSEEYFHHRVYIADRLIQTAEASALARYAEQRGKDLAAQRDQLLAEAGNHVEPPPPPPPPVGAPVASGLRASLAGLPMHDSERGLVIALDGTMFDPSRADIRPRAYPSLDQIVRAMSNNPASTATVEGHTAASGNREYDLNLSITRANAVRNYIVDHGIAAGRLTAGGVGSDYPAANDTSEAGRLANDRVDLIFR
ncbi:MAG: OmpA family protein [Rhodanobacteraceae bacterium]